MGKNDCYWIQIKIYSQQEEKKKRLLQIKLQLFYFQIYQLLVYSLNFGAVSRRHALNLCLYR